MVVCGKKREMKNEPLPNNGNLECHFKSMRREEMTPAIPQRHTALQNIAVGTDSKYHPRYQPYCPQPKDAHGNLHIPH